MERERALEDLNPRHQVLETCVLPTELKAQIPLSIAAFANMPLAYPALSSLA